MNIKAFVAGYRQGHDGLPPLTPPAMNEHELEDLDDPAESPSPIETDDHDWAWNLLGWAVGQAVALHEIAKG
jgi:hypothetical protein